MPAAISLPSLALGSFLSLTTMPQPDSSSMLCRSRLLFEHNERPSVVCDIVIATRSITSSAEPDHARDVTSTWLQR